LLSCNALPGLGYNTAGMQKAGLDQFVISFQKVIQPMA